MARGREMIRVTTSEGTGKAMKRKPLCPKGILLIILCSLVGFFMVSMLASDIICNIVFARYDGVDVLSADYAYLDDPLPRTKVTFESGKNTLTGYLYEAEAPCGMILIAHGMHRNSDSHLSEIQYFLANHWSVFAFDGTGTGESTGDSMVGLEQMALDLEAAVDYVTGHEATASLPLMLYGHSMGGYAVAVAAEHEAVKAVVSIAGFDSPMDIMMDRSREYVGGVATLGYPFLRLQNKITFGDLADRSAIECINRSEAAFLIVYGADDRIVSREDSIYGNRGEIINPHVSYLFVDDEWRDDHSTVWFSAEAVAYREVLEDELAALIERYGDRIPADILTSFCEGIDREVLFDLDEGFMSEVLQFYNRALSE